MDSGVCLRRVWRVQRCRNALLRSRFLEFVGHNSHCHRHCLFHIKFVKRFLWLRRQFLAKIRCHCITGIIGMSKDSDHIIDISFDILSLKALFLVPRICALLSMVPFFGTLVRTRPSAYSYPIHTKTQLQIPCLKEMVIAIPPTFSVIQRNSNTDYDSQIRRRILSNSLG